MEMRILVPDVPSATALEERLAVVFGTDGISLCAGSGAIDVLIDRDSSAVLPRVVAEVVRWFDQARVATVELWLGERSYRLARWVPIDGP